MHCATTYCGLRMKGTCMIAKKKKKRQAKARSSARRHSPNEAGWSDRGHRSRRNVMSEHARTRARRGGFTPTHTSSQAKPSHGKRRRAAHPQPGHTHVTRRHEQAAGQGRRATRAAEQPRGTACSTTARGRTTRRPKRDTKRPTGSTGRLTPRYPLPPPSCFSEARRGRKARNRPLLLPAEKTPSRLPLQRCSSAKNNDAGTHKVGRTQKRTINKGPAKLASKERRALGN